MTTDYYYAEERGRIQVNATTFLRRGTRLRLHEQPSGKVAITVRGAVSDPSFTLFFDDHKHLAEFAAELMAVL